MPKPMNLYRGETIYDQRNFHELLGDGKAVHVCGDVRLLSRTPPPPGHNRREYSADFADHFEVFTGSELSDRIKEQLERQRRTSDVEAWPALDQNGTPQCWANCVAGAAATCRVKQGLPYIQLSPASMAVPISGGNRGGFEGDAVRYAAQHGIAPSKFWPQHSCDSSLIHDQHVVESRAKFSILEVYDCGDDYMKMASALVQDFACLAAFSDWGHAIEIADIVEIEKGSLGHRVRNSWSDSWGARNSANFGGYAVFRHGGGPHCRPDGIFAIRQMTVHAGAEYLN